MKEFEEEKNLYFSHERFITAKNALNHESRINLLYHVNNILSGKHGFMCQYSKDLKFDTVWSSLYDITGKKIYRAEGNPQKAKYKEDTRLKEWSH
jgi:predicted choloylglycine hydrolase